jgi:hypothetical protein
MSWRVSVRPVAPPVLAPGQSHMELVKGELMSKHMMLKHWASGAQLLYRVLSLEWTRRHSGGTAVAVTAAS